MAKIEYREMQLYELMPDEEIARLAKGGDPYAMEFLIAKYKFMVRAKVRSYFLIGADQDDLLQEGMIGIYKAVRDYETGKDASFRTFAELCVTRQIISAVKAATRQKHQPLNNYVSLDQPLEGEEDRTLLELFTTTDGMSPETLFIERLERSALWSRVGALLSPLERKVLGAYLSGLSYVEIGEVLGKPEKSVDNALQRIKKKLQPIMGEAPRDPQPEENE